MSTLTLVILIAFVGFTCYNFGRIMEIRKSMREADEAHQQRMGEIRNR